MIQRLAIAGLVASTCLFVSACPTVPKESIELSYAIGKDIRAVHQAHRALVEMYFDELRNDLLAKYDEVVIPGYLFGAGDDPGWVNKGGIVQAIAEEDSEGIELWALVAATEIDRARRELIAPLDAQEETLLRDLDEKFTRLSQANASVTAHLNSLRKVQEVQDEVLKALHLEGLREEINGALATASDKAAELSVSMDKWKAMVE